MSKKKKNKTPISVESAEDKKITVKIPPILFDQTQKVIRKIQNELDGTFMTYWISDKGSIAGQDVAAFYNLLKGQPKSKKLYLFIKSDGGSGQVSLRVINLLRHFYEEIYALVPFDCASAATMMALGANKIFMGPLAYLSAIDTSITHELSPVDKDNDLVSVSQVELSRVLKLWGDRHKEADPNPYLGLYNYIHPLVFGAVDRASLLSIRLTTEILSYHISDVAEAQRISEHLNAAYPSHGYPITFREAQSIGLHVAALDENINNMLLEISALYSEMAQKAITHYNEFNYHNNEILKILETADIQTFYRQDKDWHYRKEERRWVPMNDQNSWHRLEMQTDGRHVVSKFYIS